MKFTEKSGVIYTSKPSHVENHPEVGKFYKILVVDYRNQCVYINFPGLNDNGLWGVHFNNKSVQFIDQSQFEACKDHRISDILQTKFVKRVNKPFVKLAILGPRLCGMSTLLDRYAGYCRSQGMSTLKLDNSKIEGRIGLSGRHFNLVIMDNFTKNDSILDNITYDQIIFAQTALYPSLTLREFEKLSDSDRIFVRGEASLVKKEQLDKIKEMFGEYGLFKEYLI